ncbi:hypothetical protein Z517_09246 [Fonsecaea pedrosoi CBS 271.37]|uniref:Uncharacterized protein n=1 Tax=Fonsecaea pedrosoi CBS 271.37 TaxID=1442368 RepID=A0A0D2ERB7_9EURO|nr:uncharacterized protein Z517_09246 [Fonsecaea pedrosoi CBS 271.37]KIW76802.1 hypothetical protein Z517_09246 [Fonsecaea pedrosoi CBS 271.37]
MATNSSVSACVRVLLRKSITRAVALAKTRIDVENFNVANRDETGSQATLATDGKRGGEEQDSTHPSNQPRDVVKYERD